MVLNDKEIHWLAALTDVIIPRINTPGASDVGVPAFIDAFCGIRRLQLTPFDGVCARSTRHVAGSPA